MAPICPLNLLKLLKVLLDENGGIKNKAAVERTVGLMKKFSVKLVSKCIYVQVLKTTRTEVLREFLTLGGWELTYNWLAISERTANWPLAEEILELFLLSPVDYYSLKRTAAPILVKKLAKEGRGKLVILAKHLASQWYKLVEAHNTARGDSVDMTPSTENDKLLTTACTSAASYSSSSIDNTSNGRAIADSANRFDFNENKMLIKKEEEEEDKSKKNEDPGAIKNISNQNLGECALEKCEFNTDSASLTTSNALLKAEDSKPIEKKAAKESSNKKSPEKEVKTKVHRDRESKYRKKEKRRSSSQKLSSSNSKSSKSSLSNTESRIPSMNKSPDKEKLKSSSFKDKEKRKDKSSSSSSGGNSSSRSQKHKGSASSSHRNSSGSSSKKDDKRADSDIKRNINSSNKLGNSTNSLKKNENIDSIKRSAVASPDSKLKKEKTNTIGKSELTDSNEANKPSPPKKSALVESSIFGDLLSAMAEAKRPAKRKRPAALPAAATGNAKEPKITSNNERENNTEKAADGKSTTENEKNNLNDSIPSVGSAVQAEEDEESKECVELVKVPGPGCGPDGPPSILVLHRRPKPKKKLHWQAEEKLVQVRTFEFDASERVNVTRADNVLVDMKSLDRLNERRLLTNAAVIRGEDQMRPQTDWRKPALVENVIFAEPGKKSTERDVQAQREATTLRVIYFLPKLIPDSPAEPASESVSPMEPKIIPLDNPLIKGLFNDYTAKLMPEPKGLDPKALHMDIISRKSLLLNSKDNTNQNFNTRAPTAPAAIPAFAQSGLIDAVLKSTVSAALTFPPPTLLATTTPVQATNATTTDINAIWQTPPMLSGPANGNLPLTMLPPQMTAQMPPTNFVGATMNGFATTQMVGPPFGMPGMPTMNNFNQQQQQQQQQHHQSNMNCIGPATLPRMMNGQHGNNNNNNNHADRRYRGDNNNRRTGSSGSWRVGNDNRNDHGSSNSNNNNNWSSHGGGFKKKNRKRKFKPF